MVKILEYRDLPLDDLVIGKGQVRTSDIGKDIDELANSIRVQGLLQPIVVCKSGEKSGKWEILTGQRRFLAHKQLGRSSITAAVLDGHVDEQTAKAISITENLIRRKLSGKELIDGVTYLYRMYGTQKAVVEATGLPQTAVSSYVKYPRLIPVLKELVDNGNVDLNVALKAQDSAITQDDGEPDSEIARKLAISMAEMSGVQRNKVADVIKKNPSKPVDDVIEDAKSSSRVIQVVATITQQTHTALRKFALNGGLHQDEAAALLIELALTGEGLLD
ncbi:MAG: ParB/RepB/Spo0J family partition protein [Rhodothermaceae bacterium]|nr:ParB/RepB/Spo0J family partition protein [Gammaproteobacteria bacterium]MXW15585.1 ParB/RepB/Spo0J family partition protein [Rhodothermaceae bacterium]MYC05465.1 ParB/RepB/Spo0J family partition protein [Rhodothermaceae bacterium]MYI17286.1 ParB/RepB/Spo0J family partition protein [Rhodothermaceae bacterium]